MASSDSKVSKLQANFKTLSSIAPELNNASDGLNQAVTILDEAIKKLNVGLAAWFSFRQRGEEEREYDSDQIGYDKVNGKWGIALRRIWGNYDTEEFGKDGPWLFNDAPRELRLAAVDYLPEAIEALGKTAFEATKRIQDKVKQVRELADAIRPTTPNSEKKNPSLAALNEANTARLVSQEHPLEAIERAAREAAEAEGSKWEEIGNAARKMARQIDLSDSFNALARKSKTEGK